MLRGNDNLCAVRLCLAADMVSEIEVVDGMPPEPATLACLRSPLPRVVLAYPITLCLTGFVAMSLHLSELSSEL